MVLSHAFQDESLKTQSQRSYNEFVTQKDILALILKTDSAWQLNPLDFNTIYCHMLIFWVASLPWHIYFMRLISVLLWVCNPFAMAMSHLGYRLTTLEKSALYFTIELEWMVSNSTGRVSYQHESLRVSFQQITNTQVWLLCASCRDAVKLN